MSQSFFHSNVNLIMLLLCSKSFCGSRVLDEACSLLHDIRDPSRSGSCSPVQPHLLSLSWAFHTKVLAFLQQVISLLMPGLACALASTRLFYFMPIGSYLFTLQDLAQSGSLPQHSSPNFEAPRSVLQTLLSSHCIIIICLHTNLFISL